MKFFRKILFMSLAFLAVAGRIHAADVPPEPKPDKPSKAADTTAPPGAAVVDPAAAPEGGDTNVQALLTTLNEALEENRKIRESFKNLQQSLEEKTIENKRLNGQIQDLEALSIQGSKQLTDKVVQLQSKLKETSDAVKASEGDKKAFEGEKQKILDEIESLRDENKKVSHLLKTSVLKEEKERLLKLIGKNEEANAKAVKTLAQKNSENERLKEELDSTYYNLGNTLFKMRDYEGAVAQYTKSIEWNPNNAWAHHNLAVIYDYYLGKEDLAILHYQRYLDYASPREEVHEIRRRILDLSMIKKVTPSTPLQIDFDKLHKQDKVNTTAG